MRRLPLAILIVLCLPGAASAMVKLASPLGPVRNNPADKLVKWAIEDSTYDPATRCSKSRRPGMDKLVAWLGANAKGQSWGTYRCERWGKRSASLHAEGRALDWHLDVDNAADKREATRLIRLLLAPDKAGNEQALARRMGIEEIIWDCGYWSAGMSQFKRYGACTTKTGRIARKVNKTVAHRDHIHFGMTKAGAAGRTSFWRKPTKKAPPPGTSDEPDASGEPDTAPDWDSDPSGGTGRPGEGSGDGWDGSSEDPSGGAPPEPEPEPEPEPYQGDPEDYESSGGGYPWR